MKFIYSPFRIAQIVCSLAILLSIFSSCKKEENKIYKTEILSFQTIDASGEPIKGAITANNEIYFYWPPEQKMPDSIAPVIKISEGSTVKPASGTKVPFNEQTSFSVTGHDGSVKVYKLKISPYDPEPFIKSVGFSANNLFIYPASEFYEYNLIDIENVGINEGIAANNKNIELFLVDANNTDIPLKMINKEDVPAAQLKTYLSWLDGQKGTFFVSVNKIEAGAYKKIKLKYKNHIVYYEKTINVKVRK
ncbi:hypothetical protein HDE68_002770 [Pedobacter cryoconitis]|uniref:DUF5018 domain-containing protein n=1 Tax=Pedobacter cryoconitis TaxID=188932 RepID=A0A7W8ZN76_9SPHI|nr:hypothetical protein [Pedobacter cryoconitis]MBB5636857.1 hypothetical protein [Pedobacter cryoconitis]